MAADSFDNVLEVIIGADMDRFESAMDRLSGTMQKTGKRMQRAGMAMTAGISAPIAAVGGAAVKAFADFDDAMNQSLAIMGDVSDAMENKMAQSAKQVAAETRPSARQAAESYFFLASAGLDAQQSVAALPEVAKFATAGMFDMATATDLATDAQSALGLTVDDATQNMKNMRRVMDVLVKANQLANASVQQFSEALTNRAASALKVAGKSVEEGTAVLAAFADQGIKGRRAGMQLSRIMRLLSQNAAENTEKFRELGLVDTEGNLADLSVIVRNLTKRLGGLSDQQQAAALKQLGFTARVQQAIKPLLGAGNQIESYRKQLENAGGAMDAVASKQMRSLKVQLRQLWQQIKIAGIELGATLEPAVRRIGAVLTGALKWFRSLSDEVQRWIAILGGAVAAIGPLLVVIGTLMTLLSTISGIALAAGAAIAGVAVAIAAKWNVIAPVFRAAEAAIVRMWQSMQGTIGQGDSIWDSFLRGLATALNAVQPFLERVMLLFQQAWRVISDATTGLVRLLVSGWKTFGGFIVDFLGTVWTQVSDVFITAGQVITNALGAIVDVLTGDFTGAWRNAKQTISALARGIGRIVLRMVRGMLQQFQNLAEFVPGVGSQMSSGLQSAIDSVQSGINRLTNTMGASEGTANSWGDALLGQTVKLDSYRKATSKAADATEKLSEAQANADPPSVPSPDEQGQQGTTGSDASGGGATTSTSQRQFGSSQAVGMQKFLDQLTKAKQKFLDQLTKAKTKFKLAKRFGKRFGRSVGRAVTTIIQPMRLLQGEADSLSSAFKQAGNQILGVLEGMISKMASAFAQAAALRGIMSIFSLGSIGGASTFSGILGNVLGLAEGGVVTSPTLAMVGEGREKEAVMPLSKLESMMGGGGGNRKVQQAGQPRMEAGEIRIPFEMINTANRRGGDKNARQGI